MSVDLPRNSSECFTHQALLGRAKTVEDAVLRGCLENLAGALREATEATQPQFMHIAEAVLSSEDPQRTLDQWGIRPLHATQRSTLDKTSMPLSDL